MAENFTTLAAVSDIPLGKMYRAEHDGSFYLLANVEGSIYAVDDMCTHEDASLYKGSLHGDCVECPLHGSRFDLKTGEPQDDPAEDPVRTYPVKIDGDDVLVDLGA